MEILTKKCDFIRKKSFGLEKYVENNTIYVVLGPKDSKVRELGFLFIFLNF